MLFENLEKAVEKISEEINDIARVRNAIKNETSKTREAQLNVARELHKFLSQRRKLGLATVTLLNLPDGNDMPSAIRIRLAQLREIKDEAIAIAQAEVERLADEHKKYVAWAVEEARGFGVPEDMFEDIDDRVYKNLDAVTKALAAQTRPKPKPKRSRKQIEDEGETDKLTLPKDIAEKLEALRRKANAQVELRGDRVRVARGSQIIAFKAARLRDEKIFNAAMHGNITALRRAVFAKK